MTNITTPRLGDAVQADRLPAEVEPGAPDATTPEARTSGTDDGRRRHLAPLLALGISIGAAALAVFAIATDDAARNRPHLSSSPPTRRPPSNRPPPSPCRTAFPTACRAPTARSAAAKRCADPSAPGPGDGMIWAATASSPPL